MFWKHKGWILWMDGWMDGRYNRDYYCTLFAAQIKSDCKPIDAEEIYENGMQNRSRNWSDGCSLRVLCPKKTPRHDIRYVASTCHYLLCLYPRRSIFTCEESGTKPPQPPSVSNRGVCGLPEPHLSSSMRPTRSSHRVAPSISTLHRVAWRRPSDVCIVSSFCRGGVLL